MKAVREAVLRPALRADERIGRIGALVHPERAHLLPAAGALRLVLVREMVLEPEQGVRTMAPRPIRVGRTLPELLQRLRRIVRLEDGGILQDIPVPATLADEDRLLRAHPCER